MALTGHPRLIITPANRAAKRTKCIPVTGSFATRYQTIIDYANTNYSTVWPQNEVWGGHFAALCLYIYQMETEGATGANLQGRTKDDYGNLGVSILLNRIITWPATNHPFDNLSRCIAMALCYDWGYDLMTSQNRQDVATYFKSVWNDIKGRGALNSGWWDDNDYTYHTLVIMNGMAIAGDGFEDAAATEMVAFRDAGGYFGDGSSATGTAGRRGTIDMLNWYVGGSAPAADGYGGSGYHQGMNYMQHMLPQTVLCLFYGMEAMRTYEDITPANFWGNDAYCAFFKGALPWRWRHMQPFPAPPNSPWIRTRLTDANRTDVTGTPVTYASFWPSLLKGLYKGVDNNIAGFAQWYATNYSGEVSTNNTKEAKTGIYPLWLAVGEEGVTAKSPVDLNWTTSWRSSAHDLSYALSTSLTDSDRTQININATRWIARAIWQAGNYWISRKGPLVPYHGITVHHQGIRSGTGKTDRGMSNLWYGAPNLGILDEANEDFANTNSDMGGQRVASLNTGLHYNLFIDGSVYDSAKEMFFHRADGGVGPTIDVIHLDITRSYRGAGNTGSIGLAKLPANASRNFDRFFVFIRGASRLVTDFLIVFDRVQANTSRDWEFRRHIPVPGGSGVSVSINGVLTDDQPVRNSSGTGRQKYSGMTQAVVTDTTTGGYDGKIWHTVAAPAAVHAHLINDGATLSQNYENPQGVQEPYSTSAGAEQHQAGDRTIEVIPDTPGKTFSGIIVHEIGISSIANPVTTTPISGSSFIGTRIGSKLVIFTATGDAISNGTFTVPVAGTYTVYFVGLAANGQYSVNYGAGGVSITATANGVAEATIAPNVDNQTVSVDLGGIVSPPAPGRNVAFSKIRKKLSF